MYRAVIFDFDGTIIDTERHLFETINKHLKFHKAEPISVDFYRESIGGTATDLHQHLEQAIGADNKRKIYQEHHQTSGNLPIISTIKELMDYLKSVIYLWQLQLVVIEKIYIQHLKVGFR